MSAPTKPAEREPHRLSEIFPRMTGEEIDVLAKDIQANGLKEPITMHEDKILDGNNRYKACLKIGYRFKEIDFRLFDPKVQGDALAFVVSANLHRRHLNETQRAGIAATLVTTQLGYNQYNRTSVTNKQAADMLGVSEATVKTAKKVAQKAAPEILEKLKKGELRLGAAKKLLDTPKEQQLAELNKQKAEAKAEAEARKKQSGTGSKQPKTNQAMKDVDAFKAKWEGFDQMQRRVFVSWFKDELATLLEDVRQEEAMRGAKAA